MALKLRGMNNMKEIFPLSELKKGSSARVYKISADGAMRRRLIDIGLIKDTKVECIGKSAAGDPRAYLIRGAVIALRSDDSKNILVY